MRRDSPVFKARDKRSALLSINDQGTSHSKSGEVSVCGDIVGTSGFAQVAEASPVVVTESLHMGPAEHLTCTFYKCISSTKFISRRFPMGGFGRS